MKLNWIPAIEAPKGTAKEKFPRNKTFELPKELIAYVRLLRIFTIGGNNRIGR